MGIHATGSGTNIKADYAGLKGFYPCSLMARVVLEVDSQNWNGVITNKSSAAGNGLNICKTSNKWATLVGNGSSYKYVYGNTIDFGRLYFLVAQATDTSSEFWEDGVLTDTETIGIGSSGVGSYTMLGRFYSTSASINISGTLYEAAVFNKMLSEKEIKALMSGNLLPIEISECKAWWKLTEGVVGQSANGIVFKDYSKNKFDAICSDTVTTITPSIVRGRLVSGLVGA